MRVNIVFSAVALSIFVLACARDAEAPPPAPQVSPPPPLMASVSDPALQPVGPPPTPLQPIVSTSVDTPTDDARGEVDTKTSRRQARLQQKAVVRVSGEMSVTEVKKVLSRKTGAVKACYERPLQMDPSLKGTLTVRFTINKAGRVAGAELPKNELGLEVGRCVVSAFKRFRFPLPEGELAIFDQQYRFLPAE